MLEVPIKVDIKVDETQFNTLMEAINKLTSAVANLAPQYHFAGGGFMRTYAGDRPDDTVKFVKPSVVDSEGTPVDPQPALNYTFTSDKPEICEIINTVDNGPDVDLTVHYGTPVQLPDNSYDMAEVKAESDNVDLPDGSAIKDVKTEQIQLVPGVAAGFSGGGFGFPEV